MTEQKVIDLRKKQYDIVVTNKILVISTEGLSVVIDDKVLEQMERAVEV